MYAVFDANNFYVSCERVVNPKLRGVPVVVANPGGIVLARSNEAKELGIAMAAPVFKIQEEVKEFDIKVIPTHFALYTDLSQRIASVLHQNFPTVEEYSIDESFVFFPENQVPEEIQKRCEEARGLILRWTGVPVSVGIASTKTLAKVAVKLAKKSEQGVKLLLHKAEIDDVLERFPVGDLWGIGRALGRKLPAYGICTAAHLAQQDALLMRKKYSVTLAHTIHELNGKHCFTCNNEPKPAKSLMCTESYRVELESTEELFVRLSMLATRAGKQLRQQREVAGGMGIFIRGNRFHKERGYLAQQRMTLFAPPTADTSKMLRFVEDAVAKIFLPQMKVKRAGVFLFDLLPEKERQYGLFESSEKEIKAMAAIDKIENKWKKKGGVFLQITV